MASVITQQHETLDGLCYRVFGHTDHLEELYNLNPGIEEQGTWLPAGVTVIVPDITTSTTGSSNAALSVTQPKKTIKLWE